MNSQSLLTVRQEADQRMGKKRKAVDGDRDGTSGEASSSDTKKAKVAHSVASVISAKTKGKGKVKSLPFINDDTEPSDTISTPAFPHPLPDWSNSLQNMVPLNIPMDLATSAHIPMDLTTSVDFPMDLMISGVLDSRPLPDPQSLLLAQPPIYPILSNFDLPPLSDPVTSFNWDSLLDLGPNESHFRAND
jgi:hypothetical protein